MACCQAREIGEQEAHQIRLPMCIRFCEDLFQLSPDGIPGNTELLRGLFE